MTSENSPDRSWLPMSDHSSPDRPPFPVVGTMVALAGAVILTLGVAGWGSWREELASQHIIVSQEGRFFPGQPVDGPLSAFSQAEVVQTHLLEETDGTPFAHVSENDPHKILSIESTVTRTYLLSAVMGFVMSGVAVLGGATLTAIGVTSATRRSPNRDR